MCRFRWVDCQLDALKKCFTVNAVRQVLRALPKTLDETYDRILNGIPEEYCREAHCVLQLLCVAYRNLTLDEVAEAVAIDLETETFTPENRLRDKLDIFDICSSLVTLHG